MPGAVRAAEQRVLDNLITTRVPTMIQQQYSSMIRGSVEGREEFKGKNRCIREPQLAVGSFDSQSGASACRWELLLDILSFLLCNEASAVWASCSFAKLLCKWPDRDSFNYRQAWLRAFNGN